MINVLFNFMSWCHKRNVELINNGPLIWPTIVNVYLSCKLNCSLKEVRFSRTYIFTEDTVT